MQTFTTYKTADEKLSFLSTLPASTIIEGCIGWNEQETVDILLDKLATYSKSKTIHKHKTKEYQEALAIGDFEEMCEQLSEIATELETLIEDKAQKAGYTVMYHPDYPGTYMQFKQYKCKRCSHHFDAMTETWALCDCIWEV